MDLEKLREVEYIKCVDLLTELLDLDADAKEKIHKCFQKMGIKSFFLRLESLDLPPQIFEKLNSIKSIIDLVERKRGQVL